MSVTYENITDGQNVGTWAGNLNTFGNAVVNEFSTVESNISDLESAKISKTDTGVLFLTNATPNPQNLTTTYAKVDMVDTVSINVSNGHISYDDDVSKTITFTNAGVYELSFSGSITADNGVAVTFNYNLNGSHLISNPPVFTGKGSTPVLIENHLLVQVSAGASLYIEALANTSATLTPLSSAYTIEKTPY